MTALSPPQGEARWRGRAAAPARSALVALAAFLTVVDLFATQAILPALAATYRVTPAVMSLAVNATTLGMAVASLATALVAPHIDRRRGAMTSLALLAVPTLLLAVAPDVATFAALRIAQGVCMAAAFSLTLAFLGERFTGEDAGSAFAAYIAGNVASNLFGRLISAGVADHLGLTTNFIVFAALNLAGAALIALLMRGQGTVTRTPAPPAMAAMRGLLADRRLAAAFAIGSCILFTFIGTFTFVNFVLVEPPLGLSMMSLGLVYLVFLPSIPTTLLAGRAVRTLGSRGALWLGLGGAGLGLVLLLKPALATMIAGLGLVASGTFLAQAVATGFVGRHAGAARGTASGLYLGCYFAGGLLGTAVLGVVYDRLGWPSVVAVLAVVLVLAAVLTRRLREPT
jgi:predicted MFS family arabinose efflux permease